MSLADIRLTSVEGVEVEWVEHLLVRVDATTQRCVVTDQLQRRDGCQGGQNALLRIQLDQEVDLGQADNFTGVFKRREYDSCRTALFDL